MEFGLIQLEFPLLFLTTYLVVRSLTDLLLERPKLSSMSLLRFRKKVLRRFFISIAVIIVWAFLPAAATFNAPEVGKIASFVAIFFNGIFLATVRPKKVLDKVWND